MKNAGNVSAIVPPLLLFLDDGVHLCSSVDEAEQSLEAVDIENHPEWIGCDAECCGIRFEVFADHRNVLGLISMKAKKVHLRSDRNVSLETPVIKNQLMDFIQAKFPDAILEVSLHLTNLQLAALFLRHEQQKR